MKGLFLFALIAIGSAAIAQQPAEQDPRGVDVTQQFLNTYSGKLVEPEFHESLVINRDGSVSRMEDRQVGGGSDSQVPYETVCSYIYRGKITSVIKRSQADRDADRWTDFATHILVMEFDSVQLTDELEPKTTSNPNCLKFLEETKARLASGGGHYSIYSELLDSNTIRLQTAGGGDYVKGGPRTPSTLDEVYSKIQYSGGG